MRELVAEHRAQFSFVEESQDSRRTAHRRVLRITSRRKRIGRLRRTDVQRRHRLPRLRRELAHHPVHHRRLDLRHRLRMHRLQRHLGAVEVHVAVHGDRKDHRPPQNRRTPETSTDRDDQRRHRAEQKCRLHTVSHQILVRTRLRRAAGALSFSNDPRCGWVSVRRRRVTPCARSCSRPAR